MSQTTSSGTQPSQTSNIELLPNHFAAGMMWRVNGETGGIEFLTIRYTQAGRPAARKFPGGTNRISKEPLKYRNERPEQTLQREWKTEVGQTLQSMDANPAVFNPGGGHTQFFFLLDASDVKEGEIRKGEMTDREVGQPDETLGEPEWISAEALAHHGGRYEMRGAHAKALEKAVYAVRRKLAQ